MKTFTVKMTIHHGDFRMDKEITSSSVELALTEVVGYGGAYCPQYGSPQFDKLVVELSESEIGKVGYGWGWYYLTVN